MKGKGKSQREGGGKGGLVALANSICGRDLGKKEGNSEPKKYEGGSYPHRSRKKMKTSISSKGGAQNSKIRGLLENRGNHRYAKSEAKKKITSPSIRRMKSHSPEQ